jgi:hypothetical protein
LLSFSLFLREGHPSGGFLIFSLNRDEVNTVWQLTSACACTVPVNGMSTRIDSGIKQRYHLFSGYIGYVYLYQSPLLCQERKRGGI